MQHNIGNEKGMTAQALREKERREQSYREQALKLFPWVCGICCREFSGKKLKELTVHHKDHNHDNNPPDGSNWELLCIYCHDNVHSRTIETGHGSGGEESDQDAALKHQPFGDLAALLKK
jgi:hypothetical protein